MRSVFSFAVTFNWNVNKWKWLSRWFVTSCIVHHVNKYIFIHVLLLLLMYKVCVMCMSSVLNLVLYPYWLYHFLYRSVLCYQLQNTHFLRRGSKWTQYICMVYSSNTDQRIRQINVSRVEWRNEEGMHSAPIPLRSKISFNYELNWKAIILISLITGIFRSLLSSHSNCNLLSEEKKEDIKSSDSWKYCKKAIIYYMPDCTLCLLSRAQSLQCCALCNVHQFFSI